MASTTKTNPRYAFQYTITLDFVDGDGETHRVDQNFIKYVSFDFDYEVNTIPVIYVSFSATNEIYDLLMENEQVGKVFFNLYRDNKYSNSSLSVRTVKGEFSYIPSTGNLNYTEELDLGSSTADNSYRVITIALIDEARLNLTKMYTNRIFHEIDTSTLLGILLEDIAKIGDVIIKAPKYIANLGTEIIPPMTSIKSFLKYLFNQAPFYDTDFIFFLDFDRCYLLDKKGEGCEIEDGTYHTIVFDIQSVMSPESYYDGIELDDSEGQYTIHVNPSNANFILNRSQDRVANRLVVINEEGYNEDMDVRLDVNSTAYSADKLSFIRATDARLIKNIMESNTVFVTIQKPYIDSQIFTPNKKFRIANYPSNTKYTNGYKDYNGDYTLAYKKEIIINNGGIFNELSEFGLRRVGNVMSTGGVATDNATNQSKNKYYVNSTTTPSSSTKFNSKYKKSQTIISSSTKATRNKDDKKEENTSNEVRAVRPVLNASGPTKVIKATEQNPNLMRNIGYRKDNKRQ